MSVPSSDTTSRPSAQTRMQLAVRRHRRHRRGAAPRSSSTCVKPPVEAPTSRQTRPCGSKPKWSSAAASFTPPRDTQGCAGVGLQHASDAISVRGLAHRAPSAVTRPASIAACALARLSNRPRSTRRRSARRRRVHAEKLARLTDAHSECHNKVHMREQSPGIIRLLDGARSARCRIVDCSEEDLPMARKYSKSAPRMSKARCEAQERHAQEWAQRQEGEEPQAGDCNRTVGSPGKGKIVPKRNRRSSPIAPAALRRRRSLA